MGAGVDFVVFGFGLGAILMLVGFALRDLGPWLFGSARHEEALPEFEGVKSTIRKQTLSSIGNAISVAGAGVAAVTFSALLAKSDDDLGAIVVGMSLVLATVGVGAWTYDVFRRYRTALDIVAAQEEAARQRLAPRQKRRRPKPAPVAKPAEQPSLNAPTSPTDQIPDGEPAVAAEAAERAAPITMPDDSLDEPLPAWDAPDEKSETVPSDASDAPAVSTPPAPPVNAPSVTRITPGSQRRRLAVEREESAPSNLAANPERREPSASPRSTEPAEDALIDEAVRLEPRIEPKRELPSWLFEDLEADLASTNARQPEDPIDHFQEAKPVTKPSALDRLLSDDRANGDQSTGSGPSHARRQMRRDGD